MNYKELIEQKNNLRKDVVYSSDIEMALIREAARAGADIKYFVREYMKAKESLRGLDSDLFKFINQEELKKDLLTITIVNAYETIRSEKK